MGNLITSLLAQISELTSRNTKILMVGLDAAGKTSILFRLKLNVSVATIPTIGFNVETVEYKRIKFTIYDVGGQRMLRKIWRECYSGTNAVIFVVDSNDVERISEARDELLNMMNDELLKDAKCLVFANKMDLPYAMSTAEITQAMELNKLKSKNWFLQPCCAHTGEGLLEGLNWLSNVL